MTEYLTLDGFGEILREVGLNKNHVASKNNGDGEPDDHAVYLDCAIGAEGDYRMILVITTYALNEKGHRYFGLDGKIAKETRRFFFTSMGSLEACPTVREEEASTR